MGPPRRIMLSSSQFGGSSTSHLKIAEVPCSPALEGRVALTLAESRRIQIRRSGVRLAGSCKSASASNEDRQQDISS